MAGTYNNSGWNPGQFMASMFDNWQTNQYAQSMRDWQDQYNQYQQDYDYWKQMNDYDRGMQQFNARSSGQDQGPLSPRAKPQAPGGYPISPIGGKIDFGAMFGGGGGGWSPTAPPGGGGGGFNYGAFNGPQYQAPEGWNNPGIDTANMVDPSAVIASAQPGIMENMNKAFAEAGNRFGSSGMVGTPYSDSLGQAARGAANDIANITNQYTYQSALDAAQREQQRALAEYGADYNAWAQSGDWAHQGQLANMNQALGAWGQMGDWQNQQALQGSQLANQQWMAQNDWGFQDYQNQQNQMMQYLPMLMQMMQGWG